VTEPAERATQIYRIAPYTMHWSVSDDRIDGAQSDSYALHTKSGVIFVDPLPMTYAAAERFPSVGWALLTRGCHQRASWRYRREHGARVVAPRGSRGLLTEPDQHYTDGTRLPAGFQQIRTPGPEYDHFALFRPGEPSILFVGDLVHRRDSSGPLQLAPVQQGLAPDIGRKSLERLLELDFDLLCLSHGGYIDDDPRGALQELLERSA
jgi:glyoxylase-like metal-dependent hydrolase (beta-lactamase superfamily II)